MTTLEKTLLVATAIFLGFGIYESRQASSLSDRILAIEAQHKLLATEAGESQRQHDAATNHLASLPPVAPQAEAASAELLRLRGEVAMLRAANREAAPEETALRSWARKTVFLKERLEQMPDKKIPEVQLLNDKDWADAAWDIDLTTEDGVREALSKLRDRAVNTFFNALRPALREYMKANNGMLPTNLADVRSYLPTPIDDSVFQRYALRQTGAPSSDPGKTVVELVTHVDEDYDSDHQMTMNGASGGRYNRMEGLVGVAMEIYAQKNNGQIPTTPDQIAPFLAKPLDPATVRKYLTRIASNGAP